MKIIVIVLHWNNGPDTLECLASLQKQDYTHFEVIVVDNGSTDHSLAELRKKYPHHIYLENQENLGFAEGNNRGLREGLKRNGDLFFLLNNDTLCSPNLLTNLAKGAKEHPEVGVFGPKIYFYDEPATIWYAGGGVDPLTGKCFHRGCGAFEGYNEKETTDYVCGCALAVRREVLEDVGFLSADYFLLWEEIDWCFRIRAKGYSCLFLPEARLWHKISSSFINGNRGPMWQYFYTRNRLLFHQRHTPFSQRWKKNHLKELFYLLKLRFHPRFPSATKKEAQAALMGIIDYFLGRFGKGRLFKFTQK